MISLLSALTVLPPGGEHSVFVFVRSLPGYVGKSETTGAARFQREKCYLTFEKKTRGAGRKPGLTWSLFNFRRNAPTNFYSQSRQRNRPASHTRQQGGTAASAWVKGRQPEGDICLLALFCVQRKYNYSSRNEFNQCVPLCRLSFQGRFILFFSSSDHTHSYLQLLAALISVY